MISRSILNLGVVQSWYFTIIVRYLYHKTVAIIGSGMAGLTIHGLEHYNCTIFDRSRGVGGRITTRRAPPFQFDHGAPFFKAKSWAFNIYTAFV